MAFNVKERGKLTYYYGGDHPTLSALVTERLPDGDLKIYFSGLTGGYSAQGVLGRDELVTMDPEREIPLVYQSWEKWLQDAGICASLKAVDFIEVHAFGCRPKGPNPAVDPEGYAVNPEAPLRRTSVGFDTMDHVLDAVIDSDLNSWKWKDENEFAEAIDLGLFNANESERIRQETLRIANEAVTTRRSQMEQWTVWRPPARWGIPNLVPRWEIVPAANSREGLSGDRRVGGDRR